MLAGWHPLQPASCGRPHQGCQDRQPPSQHCSPCSKGRHPCCALMTAAWFICDAAHVPDAIRFDTRGQQVPQQVQPDAAILTMGEVEAAAAADRAACTAVSMLAPISPWCCPQKECICLRRMFSMRAPHRVRMSPFSPAGAALGLMDLTVPGRSVQTQLCHCLCARQPAKQAAWTSDAPLLASPAFKRAPGWPFHLESEAQLLKGSKVIKHRPSLLLANLLPAQLLKGLSALPTCCLPAQLLNKLSVLPTCCPVTYRVVSPANMLLTWGHGVELLRI